eukprot:maker-scaffold1131_size60403-snap-gene-0.3 protein:Tk03559 transcript:maker-scaffold1131_size60403-snap-gene-0.3-mRNA-1 annotation:"valine--trna ligase"
MSEISPRYTSTEIESKWYAHWIEKNYFHSEPDDREPFSIVIPPPNVTGVLHMGHMLNNTIQDILIRKARLEGKNACWVPGTDHASIATEAKVVKMLREKGIKKSDLTREEFLEHAFAWKEEYGGIILEQLRKLGASCDWERTAFTMDEPRSAHVNKAFVDLYNRGKLYRGLRMVNWDPEAQTVLSNEEVLHEDEVTQLCHVKYMVEGSADEYIVIATTRPETIMADAAVAVHPDDERYAHLKGKNVIVPIVNRVVPIIFDDYVDIAFGTGALKITPAHDPNDYEIGKKHGLEVIDLLNDNGTLNENAQVHIGVDREVARKLIRKELKASGDLIKAENYNHSVGRSERTRAVVEPKLSLQWYVDMPGLAKPALDALWWGHRIPAWYYGDDVFVALTAEEALDQARAKNGNLDLQLADLKQDEDALDTWFSSWLWPISVFDGWRNQEELDYYYPTSVLVTGWDIIFLWVARMVMAGYEWEGKRPFDHVYFTGMVRDQQRRKMSKSLGNSPDALGLIEEFGADGVRFGMLSSSPAGGDLLFDDKLCEQGRNFSNKLWNALRLIDGFEEDHSKKANAVDTLAAKWIEQKMNAVLVEIEQNFKEYRLSEALTTLYSFVWNDYCSWYLEMIKPPYGEQIAPEVKAQAKEFFSTICTVLHPFMPFITEEIWHKLKDRADGEDCVVSSYPTAGSIDKAFLQTIEQAKDIISNVRDIRNKNGIKMKDELELFAISSDRMQSFLDTAGIKDVLTKLGVLSNIEISKDDKIAGASFISGTESFIVGLNQELDVEAELKEKEGELEHQQGFVKGIAKKLSNERFVSNAPEQVVAMERKKMADGEERIRILTEEIERLKAMV